MKTIHEKLNYIQINLKVKKEKINSFGGYKYRNLDDIFEAVKPLLKETGLTINATDEVEAVNGFNYVRSIVSISDGTESKSSEGWAREAVSRKGMDDSQITGAASSYARKYAANGLFAIDDTADADSMDNRPETLINGKLPKIGHITIDQNVKLERLSRNPKFKGADMQKQVREFIDSNPTKEKADDKILKLNTMIKESK